MDRAVQPGFSEKVVFKLITVPNYVSNLSRQQSTCLQHLDAEFCVKLN
jgi:hypothetical protein